MLRSSNWIRDLGLRFECVAAASRLGAWSTANARSTRPGGRPTVDLHLAARPDDPPRLPIAGRLRASDRDQMLAALLAALPAMADPDRDGCLLPVADDVADVLPCANLL
jgi:hypothetical protein